jgi:hypothetical protein
MEESRGRRGWDFSNLSCGRETDDSAETAVRKARDYINDDLLLFPVRTTAQRLAWSRFTCAACMAGKAATGW